jgi:hypothetical protein
MGEIDYDAIICRSGRVITRTMIREAADEMSKKNLMTDKQIGELRKKNEAAAARATAPHRSGTGIRHRDGTVTEF